MSIIHSPITHLAIHLLFHTHPSNHLIRYLHVYHAVYSVFHPSIIQPSIKSSLSTSVPPLSPSTHPPINATVDGFVGIDVFILFCLWVQRAGLLPVLQSSIHRPFTIFWPTDRALSSLPPERQRWLSSPDHQEELAATVKGRRLEKMDRRSWSKILDWTVFVFLRVYVIRYRQPNSRPWIESNNLSLSHG